MLTARRVSSFAISKSWAHTLESPHFPNRSNIRARSLPIVSTTGPGLRINFSRSDDTGDALLLIGVRCDETDAAASFSCPREGATRPPPSYDYLTSKYGLIDGAGRASRVHLLLLKAWRGGRHVAQWGAPEPALSAVRPNRSTGVRQFRDSMPCSVTAEERCFLRG